MSMKTEKIWFDGKLIRWEDAKVHVLAHALHYGTGYFEGIRCYQLADGRSAVFRLQEHIRRLADSGKILGFPHEVKKAGYDEAIMLDAEGYVSEASGENIFIVRDRKIKTTPLTSILPGITRDSIITVARDKGYELVEERFTRDELYIADEAFFTGTAAELTPIREVDDRLIGAGRRGVVTEDLQTSFFDIIKGKNGKYEKWLAFL